MSELEFSAASAELKEIVRETVAATTYDCDTFLNVKCQAFEHIKGGGNFLMTIGLFAVVNFLAKVYRHLIEPAAFVTKQDVANAIQLLKQLKSDSPELQRKFIETKIGWKPPTLHSVDNEVKCFEKLVEAIRLSGIDLGLATPKEAQSVWKTFRNGFSHMAWPNEGAAASYLGMANLSLELAQAWIKSDKPAFFKQDGQWVCNADRLNLEVRAIADWLYSEVDKPANAENVPGTLQWIKDQ